MKMRIGNGIEMIVLQYLYQQAKKEKFKKLNNKQKHCIKDKIKFSVECSQDENQTRNIHILSD